MVNFPISNGSASVYSSVHGILTGSNFPNAIRVRDRFVETVQSLNPIHAAVLLYRLEPLLIAAQAANQRHLYQHGQRKGRFKAKRPYAGNRDLRPPEPKAVIAVTGKLDEDTLFEFKMRRLDWPTPRAPTMVSGEFQVARMELEAGIKRERECVRELVDDPLNLGEIAEVFDGLSQRDRYLVLEEFHSSSSPLQVHARLQKFLEARLAHRQKHACQVLKWAEQDLTKLSGAKLAAVERYYHAGDLPALTGRHVQSLEARLAIAIISCRSVGGGRGLALDLPMTRAAARIYNKYRSILP